MTMAFAGVKFKEDDGENFALINSRWLTPQKKHVFWPDSFKTQEQFDKAVRKGVAPDETWSLCPVQSIYFQIDDLLYARKKLKLLECSSDIESGDSHKRRSVKPKRLSYEATSDDEEISNLKRPPRKKFLVHIPDEEVHTIQSNTPCSTPTSNHSDLSSTLTVNENNSPSNSHIRTCNCTATDSDFQKKVFSFMSHLRQQNNQILELLQKDRAAPDVTLKQLPKDLPVNFPIHSEEDLIKIEEYLSNKEKLSSLSSYFSMLGGRDCTSRTNIILKNLLTDVLACNYSFLGTRNSKKSFSELNLHTIVLRAVQCNLPDTTELEIDNVIKTWLKHAPQRVKVKEARKNTSK